MNNETQNREQELLIQVDCKEENPPKWGWYNTSKGKLFWYESENAWSCNDERLSEEYPKHWYKKYHQPDNKSVDLFRKELAEKKAVEKLRDVFKDAMQHPVVKHLDFSNEDVVIKEFTDEWTWYMQGWKDADESRFTTPQKALSEGEIEKLALLEKIELFLINNGSMTEYEFNREIKPKLLKYQQ